MVGFGRETEMLLAQLVRGPRELDLISIFGMPGLGKTTLAQKLYDHVVISNHFDVRLWCCSSQSYDRRSLLFELLGHTSHEAKRNDELAEMLYRSLKGKRYLIVVDDVWSSEAWDDIRSPFPDDRKGSRIVLTSRLESIATYAMICSSPHHLRLFTEEESWMLMKEKVFGEENDCPEELEEIGKQIAGNCGGLPLAVVLIAGLLVKHDKDVVYWEEVGESLKSNIKSCADIVESSYQYLTIELQKCFLYFASFAEDQIIRVSKLIRLWIAEGFVKTSTSKSLEMLGMEYLMELINSNLVTIRKTSSLDEPKTVHIHDLIHEFCSVKAEEKNFVGRINGIPYLDGHGAYCKRVSISAPSQIIHLHNSSFGRDIRSISFRYSNRGPVVDFDSDVSWERLRVLDLSYVTLSRTTLNSLPMMRNLSYLELYMYFLKIPDGIIESLTNLETFIVGGEYGHDNIPSTVWELVNLRHLVISPLYILREEINDHYNLQTCSDLVIFPGRDYSKFMKRFPNVNKLCCQLYGSGTTSSNFFPAFDSLIQLKTLRIDVSSAGAVVDPYGFEDFTYPSNLKKLTLARLDLPWSKISTVSRLSNLEVLKLDGNAFRGRQWDVKDGEYPKLKVLKLRRLEISEWTASDDSYPSLERVVVQSCRKLEEIPESFGSKCTMQLIEVRSCRDSAVNSASKIKEMQIDEMANYEFKVIISK